MIDISRYSGRCDCYDTLVMINDITDFSKYKIYAYGNDIVPLRIDCIKDLIPYYPYLVASMVGDKEGNVNVRLSERSWTDIEEEELLNSELHQLKRYYRRCKRKKEQFDKDHAVKLICWFYQNPYDYELEMVDRVATLGEKATIDGFHRPLHDHMRYDLYKEMVKAGWSEFHAENWCFGWFRKIPEWLKEDDT